MDESDIAASPMDESDITVSLMETAEKEDVDDYFENNGTYHDEKYVLQVQVIKVTA